MAEAASVLVVEDDDDIREVLADTLADHGYRVYQARHGLDALEHMREYGVPNIILLDLMMPVMNGFDFLAEKAKEPAFASVPVVVITAGRQDGPIDGVRVTLPKPIRDMRAMLRAIEQHAAR